MIRITAYKDGEALGTGAYEFERVCIGSAEMAHLRVEEEGVAPAHVEVWTEGGKCFTRLLSYEMAWVNGEELTEDSEVELTPTDRLQVSPHIDFTVAFQVSRAVPQEKKVTEVTFKTYSDISDVDEIPPEAPKPAAVPPTKVHKRPEVQKKSFKPKNIGIKDKLILIGMPLTVIFLFWWKVWPVIKKMNGWK